MMLKPSEILDRLSKSYDERKSLKIEPFHANSIYPDGSIDLHLGNHFFQVKPNKTGNDITLVQGDNLYIPSGDNYYIHPGEILLGTTFEYVSLPIDVYGHFAGRSVWGRKGLLCMVVPIVSPGFQGQLTIEISNLGTQPVILTPGLKIGGLYLSGDDVIYETLDKTFQTKDATRQEQVEKIQCYLQPFNKKVFQYLAKHPHDVYQLTPRQFEQLMMELLNEVGYEVELTPASSDGGRDIFAWIQTPIGKILTIVECKRYKPERKIGIELIERFLWVLNEKDRASCGLYVTTSFFSSRVYSLQKQYAWKLFLKDYEGLRKWFMDIGEFDCSNDGDIWIPKGLTKLQ